MISIGHQRVIPRKRLARPPAPGRAEGGVNQGPLSRDSAVEEIRSGLLVALMPVSSENQIELQPDESMLRQLAQIENDRGCVGWLRIRRRGAR